MKKVLVTGGAGYVGSGLVRDLLVNGYQVVCLDKLDFGGEHLVDLICNANFQFLKCDLNNHDQLVSKLDGIEFDSVVHLAAIVGDPACKLHAELALKTNWESSVFLLKYCQQRKIQRFVFASTCSNYGKMSDTSAYVNEDSPLAPVSLYAELKVRFEEYLLNSESDTCVTALRFSTVYGISPRMRFDLTVNEFTKELFLGKTLIIFGEQFWRPYCHVRDFSRAFQHVLQSERALVNNQVFNVGDTEENYTKKMLANELLNIFPEADISYVQKDDDPRDYRVDSTKISEILGFKISTRVPEGMAEIKQMLELGLVSNPNDQRYYNIPVVS